MAAIKEITEMCRSGKTQEAYELAKTDYAATPDNIWAQRALGWALYYMIKGDAEVGNYDKLLEHIDELKSLNLLDIVNDSMIFDNVQLQIAQFIKNHVSLNDINSPAKLSTLFLKLKDYNFAPSVGHSFLLKTYISFTTWQEMADFLDWWNLNNLTQNDYTPFVTPEGRKLMTLAERAYIANSKALLKLNDVGRIEEFLPKLDTLINQHGEMTYPGYFYGKLLLALGSNTEEALKVLIPFARKKATEFWVWQLLSDVFTNDEEKKLACLLRAVHCHTQEPFLVKVRTKLAALYIKQQQFNKARYHIDTVIRCCLSQGNHLPYEIECCLHQPWLSTTTPDANDSINYKNVTDEILCDGAEECIAVVTYVNQATHKSSMIYGHEKRTSQKLRFKTAVGNILKLHYITDNEGRIKVLSANKVQLPNGLDYAKYIEGTIDKRDDKDFAFLKSGPIRCFVSPTLVNNNKLNKGDNVKSLIAYDYNKKKESWNWVWINIRK